MSTLEFTDLRWLNLLWAVAGLAAVGAWALIARQRALRRFADAPLLPRLTASTHWGRPAGRLTLQTLCLLALVAALIHPRWGEVTRPVSTRGVDLMVLLDVSRSMQARDLAPSRLERAKVAIEQDLLPVLAGDRIGLIAFAGSARLKCPLTSDYGFFRLALGDIDTHAVPRGGSLVGDAIRQAEAAFDDRLDNERLILLVTDGEDHASFPVEAAANLWSEHRIPIIVVGLGDEREGARIPVTDDRGRQSWLTHEGEVVWSRADFDALRRVAAASELNAFVPVGTKNFDLGEIYKRIAAAYTQLERSESEKLERPSRFHGFALLALGLLLWDSLLREGPRRAGTAVAWPPARGEAA